MRRVDLLLEAARRQTQNEDYDASSGISQNELLQYVNDAQDDLVAAIQLQFPMALVKETIIQLTPDQESYTLPFDVYMGERIINVEFSPSSNVREYYKLKEGTLPERFTGYSSHPSYYIRRAGKVLLQPAPRYGFIRVNYQYAVPRLDIRQAQVAAVTVSGNSITSLTLNTGYTLNDSNLLSEEYITVIDKDGNVKMSRIPISAIDINTGIVTVVPGYTFESTESISANDYVVRGKYSTTHAQISDMCEQYLVKYVAWKIQKRDSSVESVEQNAELLACKQTIVDSFKMPDGDPSFVTILDSSFLDANDGVWY